MRDGPSDREEVWRYLDFYQFVSILEREQVYFSALSEFSDPFEGSFPVADSIEANSGDERVKRFRERFPNCVFANCWHINNRESAAMWGQYDDRGIAIKTNVKNLRDSFVRYLKGIHFFDVKYIDYEEESMDFYHRLDAYRCKRKSYEHEQELRAIFIEYPPHPNTETDDMPEEYDDSFEYITRQEPIPEDQYTSGQFHDVDVTSLIQEVRINPWNDNKFIELVKSVTENHGLDVPVTQSSLSDDPLY
ncbi:hypothetical protein GOC83_15390 [Haloarcula rubripromontorii]|uniref:DUF2971 domain-containing protein n=1 Tax=Haloarcula rubripromontorii TaxID=1705562 RepID=A0A847U8N0_9EURY|nr:hypothetical protein [Haloarcula rubripromontorii]NLV07518.1 hypothetical protein [Haloarcula rubripromontorii]